MNWGKGVAFEATILGFLGMKMVKGVGIRAKERWV